MDDLMYALDGLSAKLPASTQQESAIAIAETALTQRGRMALRFASPLQAVAKKLMRRQLVESNHQVHMSWHTQVFAHQQGEQYSDNEPDTERAGRMAPSVMC